MKFKTLTLLAGLVLGLASTQSHAALQSVHWKVDGDKKATLDTDTGIEWLDITETDGKSVNYVLSQLGVGGRYEGWRLPSEVEVLNLINSHFNTSLNGSTSVQFNGASAVDGTRWMKTKSIYDSFGVTYSRGSFGWSGFESYMYGKYIANDGNTVKTAGSLSWVDGGGSGYFKLLGGEGSYSKDWVDRDEVYGVFLVSDGGLTFSSLANPMQNINNPNAPVNAPVAAVSAPAAFGGIVLSLMAIFGRIKRRR